MATNWSFAEGDFMVAKEVGTDGEVAFTMMVPIRSGEWEVLEHDGPSTDTKVVILRRKADGADA